MKLYRILLTGIAIIAGCSAMAQETCPLPIMVQVDNADGSLSDANVRLLDSKLKQLVASKGYGSNAELSHLCLQASVSDNGDKQIISGNRKIVSGSYEIYLVLTNLLSGENFGAGNISVKGAGNSESQQMQAALSHVNPSNRDLQILLQNARIKVFDYYRSHIPSIINQALSESQRGNYDKALYILATVPPCVEGQDSVAAVMLRVYQEYLDVDCNKKLTAARAVWGASQNEEGASAAAAYIAAIDRRSSCYPEAQELLAEISSRIDENLRRIIAREDEDRALQQELIRGEADLRRQQVQNDYELRQAEIEAIRQIGLAYAQTVIGDKIRNDRTPRPYDREKDNKDGEENKKGRIVIIDK